MQEVFEPRELVSRSELGRLSQRDDLHSARRLALHASTLVALAVAVVAAEPAVLWLPASAALAAVIASMFAPFHECTHSTAFATGWLNRLGAWVAAVPFGMSPTLYRDFHFAHHRHTQDPKRDPELVSSPDLLLDWPDNLRDWLIVVGGWRLLRTKLSTMRDMWLHPTRFVERGAPWARRDALAQMRWETRAISIAWLSLPFGALAGVPGCAGITCALLLSHVLQSVWLSTEHTGLPTEGSILQRTRTILTPAWVRWFLWDMSYHAEHHGWPAVPWYRLEELHAQVGRHVHSKPGYLALHRRVWRRLRARGAPTGATTD